MFNAKDYALIDLHLHLDGSLSLENARALAKVEGVELPSDDAELLSRLRVSKDCKDLNEYLERFELPLTLLQSYDSLKNATYTLCEELCDAGLIYAEIRFAPQLHCRGALTQRDAVLAVTEGVKESRLCASIILCCMRGANNKEENMLTAALTKEFLGKGVCALDLAGAEALFSNDGFVDIFEYARSLDIPFTLHAGEADGAKSVRSAIELGASRIGHGVRSVEDRELLSIIKEKGIALELCPTSNLNTCVFKGIEDYPIRVFLNNGIIATVNTDNLAVSNTSLAEEYELLANAFSLSEDELLTLALNSARATFLPENEKNELTNNVKKRFTTLK